MTQLQQEAWPRAVICSTDANRSLLKFNNSGIEAASCYAERGLRHWMILRRITQGTRSEQGSRALALFAGIFHTCRLRNNSPLTHIQQAVINRRQSLDIPPLPAYSQTVGL